VSRELEVMGDGRRVVGAVGAVGDVMMTAWGCRDDEGRKKAGKIQDARFKVQDARSQIVGRRCRQRPTGALRCLMEGMEDMEGAEQAWQASAEPHEGLEPSCDWRGWRGRRGWRDWQARSQVRFHLNATSRFVVGDRHWPATGCPPRLHKHLYLRKLKPTQAPERPREGNQPLSPCTQMPTCPYTRTPTYCPSPP
jgi:hypothetical protein